MTLRRPCPAAVLLIVLVSLAAAPAAAQSWFRIGGGLADMAMEDVNDSDYSFYEESISGYDFPDVGTGFLLDLAFGYDVGPELGVGFHWDRQWAQVSGNDGGVDGTLNLNANAFVGRVQWRPLRGQKWRLGAVLGTGPLFCDGSTRISRDTVDYGEGKLTGMAWSFDAAVGYDRRIREHTLLQLWAGWRWANLDEVKHDDAPVLKDDGSNMTLDYTGWVMRLGLVFEFGD